MFFEVLFGSICFYLSRYCYDQYAFVPLFYNPQVGFEKEKAAQFDAGVAIDDINFIDCEMPRPSKEECSGEKPFHCMNNVSISIYLEHPFKKIWRITNILSLKFVCSK